MTYPTATRRFALQFTALADAFADDKSRVIKIRCKNLGEAHKLRLGFYGFRAAARRDESIKDYPELDAVEVTIEKPNMVCFQLKDYTELAMTLDRGLRAAGIDTYVGPPVTKKKP